MDGDSPKNIDKALHPSTYTLYIQNNLQKRTRLSRPLNNTKRKRAGYQCYQSWVVMAMLEYEIPAFYVQLRSPCLSLSVSREAYEIWCSLYHPYGGFD
jgi:hypothetical protein